MTDLGTGRDRDILFRNGGKGLRRSRETRSGPPHLCTKRTSAGRLRRDRPKLLRRAGPQQATQSRPRTKKTPRRQRSVPRLELLEDRAVPAVFTVNTLADTIDGNAAVTSLREAILDANDAFGVDTINFQ